MGQRIGDDKIAVASHSSGIITLPASLLTLGGRQYRTGVLTRTIATDVALTNALLCYVYAQIVAGSPVLRVSASIPSVYKISNPTANLVAAFYATHQSSPVFGSFLNVNESPETSNDVFWQPTITGLNAVANEFWFGRKGQHLFGSGRITQSGAGTGATLVIPLPGGALPLSASSRSIVGSWTRNNGGGAATAKGGWAMVDPINLGITISDANILSTTNENWDAAAPASSFQNNDVGSFIFKVRVQGWTSTPLKDL